MKKRILISALCMAITVSNVTGGMPIVQAQEEVVSETGMEAVEPYTAKAPVVEDWSGRWVAGWSTEEAGNEQISYEVQIYKDGEEYVSNRYMQTMTKVCVAADITENGVYKYRVRIVDNNSSKPISDWSKFSNDRTYVRPEKQIETVKVTWDRNGDLSFVNPAYYGGYNILKVEYRKDETQEYQVITYIYGSSLQTEDYEEPAGLPVTWTSGENPVLHMGYGPGQYRVAIRLFSQNIDECAQNEAYGEWSDPITLTEEDFKKPEVPEKEVTLPVVDTLKWTDRCNGVWEENESLKYQIEIWKDGEYFTSDLVYGFDYYEPKSIAFISRLIHESGAYKFRIKKENYDYPAKESEWSEFTEEINYVKPSKQISSVKPEWSKTEKMAAGFKAPNCFGGIYDVRVQYRPTEKDDYQDLDTFSFGYNEYMSEPEMHEGIYYSIPSMGFYTDTYGAGQYRLAVKLYSGDINKYTHGTYGEYSDPITITEKELVLTTPECVVKGVFGGRTITFNNNVVNSTTYYALKKSKVELTDNKVHNGQSVLFTDFYGYVYYAANKNGEWSETKNILLKIPTIQKPTITQSGNKVTIKTPTPNCHIWYTTDGSDPIINLDGTSPNAKRISYNSIGTVEVNKATTIKAIAVRSAFTNSEVTSFKAAAVKVAAPSFKVVGAIGGRNVTFSSTDKDAVIYYSTTTSNITTKDKCVKNGETKLFTNYYGSLYAKAYVNGTFGNVSRLILKIPTVNTPSITAEGNGYVKISTTTPSCAIYYTTDGTTPSPTNGKKINASASRVYVGAGKTVKAIAVRSCFSNSAVATQKAK